MLSEFFQLTAIPPDAMYGSYNTQLVILSYIVATFASYIALDITGRLRDIGNTSLAIALWIIGGSIAMGAGIWSMHFIGMLAFKMDDMAMAYSPFWTGVSMVVAIFASAFALMLLRPKSINKTHLAIGGVILGLAIASMHYIGMYAMTISMNIHYLPGLFTLSIIIAIVASEAALILAIKSNEAVPAIRFRLKCISAVIMGAAICGMHYTGMFAAVFTPLADEQIVVKSLDPEYLSIYVAAATLGILSIAVLASTYKEAKNQQLLSIARQAGMAEVAATVLHNVGNVLNSVNVSAGIIAEKVTNTKINGLDQLNKLLKTHENDLAGFIANDERGKQVGQYIEKLCIYWDKEKEALLSETSLLIKNIDHIKHIIGMQQNLSKTINQSQITALDHAMDEALMISGLNVNTQDIVIHKKYAEIKPVMVDRVKLLQILVNLINNAKDSLRSAEHQNKEMNLVISDVNNNFVYIKIEDNGVGIPADKMTSIFSYGFTTKKDGHGFGLHTSALAAKDMGGMILVSSEGIGKGACFTLKLPYTNVTAV